MISSLLKAVMAECGLTQSAMKDVLAVSLDRVKSLTSGKVKKFTREESEALIRKLHIRGDWLATGEGPMFQTPSERELHRRLDAVKTATEKTFDVPLNDEQKALLQQLMFAAELGDGAALNKLLNPLSTDEASLIDAYRQSSPEGRAAICATAAAMAGVKVSGGGKTQNFHAPVGQAVQTIQGGTFSFDLGGNKK